MKKKLLKDMTQAEARAAHLEVLRTVKWTIPDKLKKNNLKTKAS